MFKVGQEITLEREGRIFKSVLRGYKENDYLMVDLPDQSWMGSYGGGIVFRFLQRDKAVSFTTIWISYLAGVEQVILNYPASMLDTERRLKERYNISMPVNIYRLEGGEEKDASKSVIVDMSISGCKVSCELTYEENSRVFLKGSLPELGDFTDIGCYVRNISNVRGRRVYGLQFEMGATAQINKFRHFLDAVAIYQAGVNDVG